MNTFGKILAFCIVLLVLVALTLQIAVFSRQRNWKEYAENLKKELDVARANSKAKDETTSSVNAQASNAIVKTYTTTKDWELDKKKYEAALNEKDVLLSAQKTMIEEAGMTLGAAQAVNARQKLEIDAMGKALQQSEQDKVALRDESNKFRRETAEAKEQREAEHRINLNLQGQIRSMGEEMAKLAAKTGPTTTLDLKNPNENNPPSTRVDGRVMQISENKKDGAGTLIKLSVGRDHGVNKDNTLDIYRTNPTAEWLGTVRIIEVTERDSIGRLMSRPSPRNTVLRVGDLVIDSIASLGRN
jgi:hypothetical protein